MAGWRLQGFAEQYMIHVRTSLGGLCQTEPAGQFGRVHYEDKRTDTSLVCTDKLQMMAMLHVKAGSPSALVHKSFAWLPAICLEEKTTIAGGLEVLVYVNSLQGYYRKSSTQGEQ